MTVEKFNAQLNTSRQKKKCKQNVRNRNLRGSLSLSPVIASAVLRMKTERQNLVIRKKEQRQDKNKARLNEYVACKNNLVNVVDPFGLEWWPGFPGDDPGPWPRPDPSSGNDPGPWPPSPPDDGGGDGGGGAGGPGCEVLCTIILAPLCELATECPVFCVPAVLAACSALCAEPAE